MANTADLERQIRLLQGALQQANRIRERWHHASEKLKQAQLKLKNSEQRYRVLFDHAFDAILLLDDQYKILHANPAAEKLLAIKLKSSLGMSIVQWLPCCITLKPNIIHECDWKRSADEVVPIEVVVGTTTDDLFANNQNMFVLTIRDISARKRVEETLRLYNNTLEQRIAEHSASLYRLSQALEQTGEAVFMLDNDKNIEYVNLALCRMTERDSTELLGANTILLFGDNPHPLGLPAAAHQAVRQNKEIWHNRLILHTKSGETISVALSMTSIADVQAPHATHDVIIMQDISQREELEQRLRTAEKMQSVAVLTGGIAHEFNNILAGISGYAFLASNDNVVNTDTRDALENIEHLSYKASDLIQHLLLFSGQGRVHFHMKDINLTTLIRETCNSFHIQLHGNYNITLYLPDNQLFIHADVDRIQQLILKLLDNAALAIKEKDENLEGFIGGYISVRLQVIDVDLDLKDKHGLTSQQAAHLCIQDNGVGITEDVLENIFEPFFTTREVGQGTGLGLSIAWGIINMHGGGIGISSKIKKGSRVNVYFPLLAT
ncbi:MAG: PAS domain S-box protein [Mariprofundales bacterium]